MVFRDEGAWRSGPQDHTAVATPAHVADSRVLPDRLHGEETRVWSDQAYRGQTEVIQECAPQAQDHTHRRYRYKNAIDEEERAKNRTKSSVRSKVEHVFQGDEVEIWIQTFPEGEESVRGFIATPSSKRRGYFRPNRFLHGNHRFQMNLWVPTRS